MEFAFAAFAFLLVLAFAAQARIFAATVRDLATKHGAELLSLTESSRSERRELLDRIQHPERVVPRPQAGGARQGISPESRAALRRVGTVAPQARDGE